MALDSPLLTIDIGNSRIKFGVFEARSVPGAGALPDCRQAFARQLDEPWPWAELKRSLGAVDERFPQTIVAGVNPPALTRLLQEWPHSGWPAPRILQSPTEIPLEVRVEFPEKVGIDRLLNAVAGNRIRPAGRRLLIVGSGTATTIDSVSEDGAFEGGAILPGFELSARALHEYTALLPFVPPDELAGAPPEPLGRATRPALQSGIFWGQVGAVKELIARLSHDRPVLVVTGGGGPLLLPHLPRGTILEPVLALQGLAWIAQSAGSSPEKG